MNDEFMPCKFDKTDCENDIGGRSDVCDTCWNSFYYKPVKKKKTYRLNKHRTVTDKRQGARFEQKNHYQNEAVLSPSTVSSLTPNSGAGYIKGDEQISGIITVMEELKTRTKKQAPGKETFTIHKKWLDKLNREATEAGKEFWYLKFSFFEDDDNIYCIVPSSIIMSMITTMKKDRETADISDYRVQQANARAAVSETKCAYLEAQLKELRLKDGDL